MFLHLFRYQNGKEEGAGDATKRRFKRSTDFNGVKVSIPEYAR